MIPKRRSRPADEIMLIPFLDILCSLIGVLILIIVVLCVAQTQKINGRTPEQVQMSEDYLKLQKKLKEDSKISEELKEKLAKLEKLQEESKMKEEQIAKLRLLLSTSAADRKKNEELSQNMLKQLDNLLIETNGLATQEKTLAAEIAALKAEIEKRKPPPKPKLPSVIVQPGGSGLAKGTQVFFVEASGGKLTVYWNENDKTIVSAVPDVIATDVAFNAFLKGVLGVPQSKIIFLLRDDGMGAYNNAAGWAQATYGYRLDQIGKLPIPGRGEIDLQTFKEYRGSLQPPPPAPPADAKPPQPPQPPKNN
jgi:hypothetical protein